MLNCLQLITHYMVTCCRDDAVYQNPTFTNGMETIKDKTILEYEEENIYDEIKDNGIVAGETVPTSYQNFPMGYACVKPTQASCDKPSTCKESAAQYEMPTSPKYANTMPNAKAKHYPPQEDEYVLPDIPYRGENPYVTQDEAQKVENEHCTSLQHSVNQPPSSTYVNLRKTSAAK